MAKDPIDPDDIEALRRRITELEAAQQAGVSGSGAVAQGGGDALGEGSVKLGRDNSGTIVAGTKIVVNYAVSAQPSLSHEQVGQQVAGYLSWLCERTQHITLRGIERDGGAPVVQLPLETAYVPLRARSANKIEEAQRNTHQRSALYGLPAGCGELSKKDDQFADINLNDVLSLGNRLAIVGGPGSGKTTVLLHMAWALSSSLLSGQPEPARSRLGLTCEPGSLPLPIVVPLASYARYRRNLSGNAAAHEKNLAHFISHHLISKDADFDLPVNFFARVLKSGSDVLLLLDGLDEVASESERNEVRQSVEDLVSGRDTMRAVVTCRTVAYHSGRTALGANFREIIVQPLDVEQHITPMVRQAYACIHPQDTALRGDRIEDLLQGIQQLEHERRARTNKDAPALIDSPLMVRLLLIVHVNNRHLPDERADLFDKAINALLQVDYGLDENVITELSTNWKLYRDMGQHLAFHMHQQGQDQGREIDETALRAALIDEPMFEPRIDDFLSHARHRGSVLEERDGAYRFIHLAFQEYLVARYLREIVGADGHNAILCCLEDRLGDPWWREPILLLAGYMGVVAAQPARKFLDALANAGTTDSARFAAAEIAATAALEWPQSGAEVRERCALRIAELMSDASVQLATSPVVRSRAGDRLAQLGDPRFDAECFYLPSDDRLGFVRIEADANFIIGTRKKAPGRMERETGYKPDDNELNETVTPSPSFYIGRFPVTVAQFQAFVDETGFVIRNDRALKDLPSRPVRWVSFADALAYCDWLNEMLSNTPKLRRSEVARLVCDDRWEISLPSELEWEKAARGGLPDSIFPWGDTPDLNRANYDHSEIGNASAVGCFPANGYSLCDMAGNVWEWTRSLWGEDFELPEFGYPYDVSDRRREDLSASDEVRRVVRGGSWNDRHSDARCAVLGRAPPDSRNTNLGFRVVLRSAPVD